MLCFRIFLIFLIFNQIVLIENQIPLDIHGEHVCSRNETMTFDEYYRRYYECENHHLRHWHFRRTRERLIDDCRYDLNRIRVQTIVSCCEGYTQIGSICKPHCPDGCLYGECIEPKLCSCFINSGGQSCNRTCSKGSFGSNCQYDCNCLLDPKCNQNYVECSCSDTNQSEHCHDICKCKSNACSLGWSGYNCTIPCPDYTYGFYCFKKCTCIKENTLECSKKTGHCLCKESFYGDDCELECLGALKCSANKLNCTCDKPENKNLTRRFIKFFKTNLSIKIYLAISLVCLTIVTVFLSLLIYKLRTRTKKFEERLEFASMRRSDKDQIKNPIYDFITETNLISFDKFLSIKNKQVSKDRVLIDKKNQEADQTNATLSDNENWYETVEELRNKRNKSTE